MSYLIWGCNGIRQSERTNRLHRYAITYEAKLKINDDKIVVLHPALVALSERVAA